MILSDKTNKYIFHHAGSTIRLLFYWVTWLEKQTNLGHLRHESSAIRTKATKYRKITAKFFDYVLNIEQRLANQNGKLVDETQD